MKQLQQIALNGRHPVILRHNERQIEVCLPSGESLMAEEIYTVPRNKSYLVTPDAVRLPGSVIRMTNDLCTAWFVWLPESGLHGQFHSDADARQFCEQ